MSRHNYSQYSKQNNQTAEVEIGVTDVVIENVEPQVDVVEETVGTVETVETVSQPEKVIGVVANCSKLNVRATPDATAEVVCVIDVNSEVEIDVEKTTLDWVSVCTTTGIEGYCMRKFIEANL